MGDDFNLIISIDIKGKTKADIKTWAENMTLWDLYELSKTETDIQVTLYKKETAMVEEVTATAEDMEG